MGLLFPRILNYFIPRSSSWKQKENLFQSTKSPAKEDPVKDFGDMTFTSVGRTGAGSVSSNNTTDDLREVLYIDYYFRQNVGAAAITPEVSISITTTLGTTIYPLIIKQLPINTIDRVYGSITLPRGVFWARGHDLRLIISAGDGNTRAVARVFYKKAGVGIT